MTVETRDIAAGAGGHVVQFYEHDTELVGAVGPYLLAGVRAEEVTIVIATEAHRRALAAALEADGIDLAAAAAGKTFFSLDAARMLTAFMAAGQIDPDAFHEVIGGLMRRAAASGRAVRAYGEMVTLLWEAGDVLAAIELERLWNDLARQVPFSLFCSYPAALVSGSEHAEALQRVCNLHSSVLNPPAAGAQELDDRSLEAEFAAERAAPGHARRLVLAALRRWGYGETFADDVALVVGELTGNAVLHAGSPFSIAIRIEDATLRVAVHDRAPLTAVAPGGGGLIPRPMHGLGLIDALATRWGVEGRHDGKVVWAELPVRP
jgi:MEDS: MEthanogen/methylotroph, DcmR Sensory domain/Histidine kinase-like ATPase domain